MTDSSGERPENVYNIHKVIYGALGKSESDLDAWYQENYGKYKILKDSLASDIESLVGEMRDRRASFSDDEIKNILKDGAVKAREISSVTMKKVRDAIGISI